MPSEIVPDACPDDGEHAQLPLHVTEAEATFPVYSPAAHDSHPLAESPKKPGPQTQSLGSVLPAGDVVLATGQTAQVDDLSVS